MNLKNVFKEDEISRAISLQEGQDIMEKIKSEFSSVSTEDAIFAVDVLLSTHSAGGCRFSLDEIGELIDPFEDGAIKAVRVEAIFEDGREPKVVLLIKG